MASLKQLVDQEKLRLEEQSHVELVPRSIVEDPVKKAARLQAEQELAQKKLVAHQLFNNQIKPILSEAAKMLGVTITENACVPRFFFRKDAATYPLHSGYFESAEGDTVQGTLVVSVKYGKTSDTRETAFAKGLSVSVNGEGLASLPRHTSGKFQVLDAHQVEGLKIEVAKVIARGGDTMDFSTVSPQEQERRDTDNRIRQDMNDKFNSDMF